MKLKKKKFEDLKQGLMTVSEYVTDLKQGLMTVSEYVTRFTQLSRYAPNNMDTDEKKQD
jgi:hypothetical protein